MNHTVNGLFGPHPISQIDFFVEKGVKPGAYLLYGNNGSGRTTIRYTGRADADLNGRLHDWERTKKYTNFEYGFFDTVQAAHEKECSLYHDLKPPDNKIHPDKPKGATRACPVIGCRL